MFQEFVSKHNSPLTSLAMVSKSVTPSVTAAPILSTPRNQQVTESFLDLTISSAAGGVASVIAVDPSAKADNQVFSVCAHITGAVDLKYWAALVRFESAAVPTTVPAIRDLIPIAGSYSNGTYIVKDCATISTFPRTANNTVYVGLMLFSNKWVAGKLTGIISLNQVRTEITTLQPLK